MINQLLTHCNQTTFPCWEHYAEHERVQKPVKWVIDLALTTLKFRVFSLQTNSSIEEILRAREDADNLISLINQQWRDCVREPYSFPVKSQVNTSELKLEDLDL